MRRAGRPARRKLYGSRGGEGDGVIMSMHRVGGLAALLFVGIVGSPGAALAQAWGEQVPLQFRYINQGMAAEIARNQLGETAAAAAASSSSSLGSGGIGSGGGGGGLGQASSQLSNVVQLDSHNTYNVTITGNNNYLNVTGSTVNAQQTSTGTTQTGINKASPTSPFLN